MQAEELVRQYLRAVKIMQLATSINDQPWICTLHYCSDKDLNLYWISTLVRKHSKDIEQNPKVAATILVHENTPKEQYSMAISIEGTAELIGEKVNQEIGQSYIQKLGKEQSLLTDIANGKNLHKFYHLTPSKIVLFDNKNFPDDPRREVLL